MSVEEQNSVEVLPPTGESHFWAVSGVIEKWHDKASYAAGLDPDEVLEVEDNELTTAGLTRITSLIIGGGGQAWDATHSRIGVGSSTTAFSAGHTDLQAATNKRWATMESTYPQSSSGTMTFRSVFDSSEANYAWEEWAIDGGAADNSGPVVAPMMNRRVVSMGTKVSPAVWTFTVTITLS